MRVAAAYNVIASYCRVECSHRHVLGASDLSHRQTFVQAAEQLQRGENLATAVDLIGTVLQRRLAQLLRSEPPLASDTICYPILSWQVFALLFLRSDFEDLDFFTDSYWPPLLQSASSVDFILEDLLAGDAKLLCSTFEFKP